MYHFIPNPEINIFFNIYFVLFRMNQPIFFDSLMYIDENKHLPRMKTNRYRLTCMMLP